MTDIMPDIHHGALRSAIDAIVLAATDELSALPDGTGRDGDHPYASSLSRRLASSLLDSAATALVVGVGGAVGAAGLVASVFVPAANRPSCPRCDARTTRVGEVTRDLGAGLAHIEHLYYCPTCRAILQENLVSHSDSPRAA